MAYICCYKTFIMKDIKIEYWGKTPLTNKDVYMLNIINEDGSKTPVYENDKVLGYSRVLCDKETANKKRNELLNVA